MRLIKLLNPDWVVLRPNEAVRVSVALASLYELAATFDQTAAVAAERFVPGRNYLVGDETFMVFHRLGR